MKTLKNFAANVKRRKAHGDNMRPVWQIFLLLPVWLLYFPARKFVDWCDDQF